MPPQAPLTLAIEIDGDGAHPAAWRQAAHSPAELLDPGRLRGLAEIVERSGFTIATIDDDLLVPGGTDGPGPAGRIGSIERAAFIASATSVLSVAPVISTTYTEPFHVSSALASVDHISAGRSGWLVTTSPDPATPRAWGRPPVDDEGLRREAADAAAVVAALWDSWEDDAVIRDVATSRYLARDRLHYIDFVGETYAVKGPAIVPRPPQGRPPIFAPAGLLRDVQADVALLSAADLDGIRAAATAAPQPRTFAEVEIALDTPGQAAAARVASLDDFAQWPDRGRLRYAGTADGCTRLLRDLATVVDGVRVHPLVLDEDLAEISRKVVPALLISRTVARPLPGSTLRTTLGLPRPASQFAAPADATQGGQAR
jgi:alkanesulfonate monooxygenase SsuD/methylene tetrahydromethanopterin reductase-like flavin-dependent oxidoreductase (luciferase family)